MNNKKNIHKWFVQLPFFVIFMALINIMASIVGYLMVPSYSDWYFSELRVEDLFLIAIYAIGQVAVFSIKKIRNVIMLSCLHLFIGLILLNNDYSGYGWEICQTYTFCVSKLNHLLCVMLYNHLNYPIAIKSNVIVIFPIYLSFVSLSFRLMVNSIMKTKNNTKNAEDTDNTNHS